MEIDEIIRRAFEGDKRAGRPKEESDPLVEALTEHLASIEDPPVSKGWFRASAIGDLVAAMNGESAESPFSDEILPGNRLVFGYGTALHTWYQNHCLAPMGVLVGDWLCIPCGEVVVKDAKPPAKCPRCGVPRVVETADRHNDYVAIIYQEPVVELPDLRIRGHCDGIIEIGGDRYVLDIKTAGQSAYDSAVERIVPRHYILQVHVYMAGLGIRHAKLLVANKAGQCAWRWRDGKLEAGDLMLTTVDVPFDKAIWEEIKTAVEKALAAEGAQE